ncbi:MAG: phosphatidate cytidylyltransferase [Velocimicrobium sp.]
MFAERLISGIVLLVITIFVVITGGNILFATVTIISTIGLFELYRAIGIEKTSLAKAGYAGGLCFDLILLLQKQEHAMILMIGFLFIILVLYVITYPNYKTEHVAMVFFGLFYVTAMLGYIYRLRMLEDGKWLIWLVFIGAWGSDTCAYCVGKLLGKHKLPQNLAQLSPKKSLEGCIGGVIGAALLGFIYALCVRGRVIGISNPMFMFAIMGGAGSVISQIGDLAASAIKRNHGIKDYGKLIPGHGGILDRFDSVIFTAPIVFFLAQML